MIEKSPRERLVDLLRARSFERKRVILASGRESDFFIDCKQTILTAEGHALVGELMFDALSGLPVVILEDVITTGGSTLKAVDKLRTVGASVVGVVALVDRLEGGAEAIRAAGLPLLSICSRRDFMSDSG